MTQRRVTLRDIAEQAGVSKGLVSLVLNDRGGFNAATGARVLQIADELGYRKDRAATMLARQRTKLLGVTIVPGSDHHAALADEVQAVADAAGYEVVLGSINRTHDERRTIEMLIDSRCEALLLLGVTMPAKQLAPLIAATPTVFIGRPGDVAGVDVVRADDAHGMHALVDHLVALGHREIAHLDGGPGPIAALRRRSYRAAMRRHALDAHVIAGGVGDAAGVAAFEQVQAAGRLTAVVAFNDRSAFGLLDQARRHGLAVPSDLSITGFDNSTIARNAVVDLTTIEQDPVEQARCGVAAVVERLNGGRRAARETILPVQLVVRGSTGRSVRS